MIELWQSDLAFICKPNKRRRGNGKATEIMAQKRGEAQVADFIANDPFREVPIAKPAADLDYDGCGEPDCPWCD